MQALGPWTDRARAMLEGITTTEGRVAATVVLLAGVAVVSRVVLPRVATAADRAVHDRFDAGPVAAAFDLFGRYVPATLAGLVRRVVQATLVVVTALSVLLIWGLSGLIRDATTLVFQTVPPERAVPVLGKLATSLVLVLLAYVGARAVADAVEGFRTRTEWMTEHQEEVVLRTSQLGLFGLLGLVLLGLWGQDLGGLLVGAGFLGIVVGLAARQTLGSLIAGFVLMFSRPFTIGDWVQIGEEEGIVTDITIFNTRLENFDGEFVVIPNDRVSDRAVVNRSQKGHLRLRVDVGVDYETDPDRAKQVAMEAISDCKEVVDAPPPQVFPKAFGDSAVILELRFWIDHPTPPRKWKAVAAVIGAVKAAFEREGIEIPFPQRELSGRNGRGGVRVHGARVEDSPGTAPEPDTG